MPPKPQISALPPVAMRFGRVKSNLKMGLVGLPNVGKSSLFNVLTSQSAPAENFPFCTIDPNEARCPVPDARFEYLCDLWHSPSMIPPYLHVTDIAGLIRGASEGAGLGNAFLSHIQAVDGIFHLLRCFDNPDVVHVEDTVDPVRDLEIVTQELCKKDLENVARAEQVEAQQVRKAGPGKYKLSPLFLNTMEKLKQRLGNNLPVRSGEWTASEIEMINEKTQLITAKPMVFVANLSMQDYLSKKNKWLGKVNAWIQAHGGGALVPISVEFEQQFVHNKDIGVSALPKLVKMGYEQLNLIYFFTAGEKEVRAWTVYQGANAVDAASVIHTDFGKAFIKAEVVAYEDFKQLCNNQKSMAPIRAAGKYRIEGKNYIVQDGDIIYFQIGQLNPKKK